MTLTGLLSRQRKSKCDRGQPCLSCVLRSTEDRCVDTKGGSTSRAVDAERAGSSRIPANGTQARPILESDIDSPRSLRSSPRDNQRAVRLSEEPNVLRQDMRNADRRPSGFPYTLGKAEIEAILPSIEDVEEVCHCFFTDLDWYQSGVDPDTFSLILHDVQHLSPGSQISSPRLALVCGVLAFGLLFAPRNHPASQLSRPGQKDRLDPHWQIENMRMLLDVYYNFGTHEEENGLGELSFSSSAKDQERIVEQVSAETLFCYYCSVAGLVRRFRASIGRAIHLAMTISLFDESNWGMVSSSGAERRRRIAWDLLTLERWSSLHTGRSSLLSVTPNLRHPNSTTTNIHLKARNTLADVASVVLQFLHSSRNVSLEVRMQDARAVDEKLCQYYDKTLPPNLRFHLVKDKLTIGNDDASIVRDVATALLFYLSQLFLRCIVMRGFLLDPRAPAQTRFASITHARSTISTLPYLVHLSTVAYVTSPPAWNTQFIYAAATTFATLLLSAENEHMSGTDEPNGSTSSWPKEELDWFTSKLIEVLRTFDIIASGVHTHTARTCKRLLEGLCKSKETLQIRFQKRQQEQRESTHGFISSRPSQSSSPWDRQISHSGASDAEREASVRQNGQNSSSLFEPIDIHYQPSTQLSSSGHTHTDADANGVSAGQWAEHERRSVQ